MDLTAIRVLSLGIAEAGDHALVAEPSAWHRAFLTLKKKGILPEIFAQLHFAEPSGDRPYSEEVERLLFQFTRAGCSTRHNPFLRVIEIPSDARSQLLKRYETEHSKFGKEIKLVSEFLRVELKADD